MVEKHPNGSQDPTKSFTFFTILGFPVRGLQSLRQNFEIKKKQGTREFEIGFGCVNEKSSI